MNNDGRWFMRQVQRAASRTRLTPLSQLPRTPSGQPAPLSGADLFVMTPRQVAEHYGQPLPPADVDFGGGNRGTVPLRPRNEFNDAAREAVAAQRSGRINTFTRRTR